MSYRSTTARALLFAGAAVFVTPAHAATQDAVADQPAAAEAAEPEATGDIVVTARRTEENVQRVPAAISAFSEKTLDRIQATDTTGLQGAVPNLNVVLSDSTEVGYLIIVQRRQHLHPRHRPAGRPADLRPRGRRLCRRCLPLAHPRQPA